MKQGTVWQFRTAKLTVRLEVQRDRRYRYDGDDPDGETQAKLDSGEYVAFDSRVVVELADGTEIGSDALSGSVYGADNYAEFWTAHRGLDPMDRNCTLMREARGGSPDAAISICHYFPDMVRQAIAEARALMPRNL